MIRLVVFAPAAEDDLAVWHERRNPDGWTDRIDE